MVMRLKIQFAGWLLASVVCAGLALPCAAQKPRDNNAAQRQERRQERQQQNQQRQNQNQNRNQNQNHPANPNRPPAYTPPLEGPKAKDDTGHRGTDRPNPNIDRANGDRPNANKPNLTPRQQLGVGAPRPWVDQMREMHPAQREKVLQNNRTFQNLPPQQQESIRKQFHQWDHMSPQQRADQAAREDTWRRMTPEQREHIKNDVLPQWRQMPQDRKQAIQQRLHVLQNMPESARNQRLNDPEFTRGMSEEDRATLRDLSHLHVGGAPDPPAE